MLFHQFDCRMPRNYNAFVRYMAIDEALQGGKYKSIDQLIEMCFYRSGYDASARTIEKDIRFLRKELDAPIPKAVRINGVRCYYYSDPSFSITQNPLIYEDILVLKQVRKVFSDFPRLSFLEELNQLVDRLDRIMQTGQLEVNKAVSFERNLNVEGLQWINQCYSAITRRRKIKVMYQPFDFSETMNITVSPLLLKEYRNRWFLFGREQNNHHIMNLALDRIQSIEITEIEITSQEQFDSETFFHDIVGVSKPYYRQPVEVKLWVSAAISPYWQTKPLHQTQQLISHHEDGDIYRLCVIPNFELKAEILRYGSEVKVLQPDSLRQEIADEVAQLTQLYS